MKRSVYLSCILSLFSVGSVCGVEQTEKVSVPSALQKQAFLPFTGKITKNKVRMRIKPSFEDHVLREMKSGDLVVVLGEVEDFYAVQPPSDIKGYVYRTLILDHVVEGNRVNVRLNPDLESPVIAQLNQGDRVEGQIDSSNSKWMQIQLPSTSRFYIAKDYVENVGDAGYMERFLKKQKEAATLLDNANSLSSEEIQKPFRSIQVEQVKKYYEQLINNYKEFPQVKTIAQEKLANFQEQYLKKKLQYLEEQSKNTTVVQEVNEQLTQELNTHKARLASLEKEMYNHRFSSVSAVSKNEQLPVNITSWVPVEEKYFAEWSQSTGVTDPQAFYSAQEQESFTLQGTLESYQRPVKNRPGDYLLTNSVSKLPVAFLYSTHVNLQDYVGKEVKIRVVQRDNHHFAFPAYFVLSIE